MRENMFVSFAARVEEVKLFLLGLLTFTLYGEERSRELLLLIA